MKGDIFNVSTEGNYINILCSLLRLNACFMYNLHILQDLVCNFLTGYRKSTCSWRNNKLYPVTTASSWGSSSSSLYWSCPFFNSSHNLIRFALLCLNFPVLVHEAWSSQFKDEPPYRNLSFKRCKLYGVFYDIFSLSKKPGRWSLIYVDLKHSMFQLQILELIIGWQIKICWRFFYLNLFNLDIVDLLREIEMINTSAKTFDSGRYVSLCTLYIIFSPCCSWKSLLPKDWT